MEEVIVACVYLISFGLTTLKSSPWYCLDSTHVIQNIFLAVRLWGVQWNRILLCICWTVCRCGDLLISLFWTLFSYFSFVNRYRFELWSSGNHGFGRDLVARGDHASKTGYWTVYWLCTEMHTYIYTHTALLLSETLLLKRVLLLLER